MSSPCWRRFLTLVWSKVRGVQKWLHTYRWVCFKLFKNPSAIWAWTQWALCQSSHESHVKLWSPVTMRTVFQTGDHRSQWVLCQTRDKNSNYGSENWDGQLASSGSKFVLQTSYWKLVSLARPVSWTAIIVVLVLVVLGVMQCLPLRCCYYQTHR